MVIEISTSLVCMQFLPRDATLKRGLCRRAVSICPFVTFVNSVKTRNRIGLLKLFPFSGSQTILAFPYQTSWQYSDGDAPELGRRMQVG